MSALTRVCHLVDQSIDYPLLRSIYRHHDRNRFTLSFGSTHPRGALQEVMTSLGAEAFSLDARHRRSIPRAVVRLASLLRKQRVSILHAHLFEPTAIGLLAARLAGAKFIFTRHHSDHHHRMGKRFHVRLDSWCARHADRVLAVSEATRRILIDKEGVPSNLVSVAYNGVAPFDQPPPARLAALRRDLGIEGKSVCLMIGRLHEEKGHRFLFEALEGVRSEAGPLMVLLAGAGSLRETLEADVRHRGLSDIVRFLGRRSDIPDLIAISDVIALPSLAESFGLSLVEAMALGKPVVASAVGGIPEVVGDGDTGLIVPPGNSAALKSALVRILKNRELASKLGEAGRERAAFFSEERMMRAYEDAYAAVLA